MKPIGVLGICFDEKSSFLKGAAEAPDVIRHVLHDGSSNEFAENGINPFSSFMDRGNLENVPYTSISSSVEKLLTEIPRFIVWGGDHSITFPIIQAYAKSHADFDIIQIDAHGDLYDQYEGDRFSHACPFARIMESGLCNRLIQIGIRTLTPHQRQQVRKWKVKCIEMKDIQQLNNLKLTRPVYLSIDLDGFDPAYAPGVSHNEPGGLAPRTIFQFLSRIHVPVIGADIVEYNPTRDVHHTTAYLAAKLTKEVAATMIANEKPEPSVENGSHRKNQ